MEILGLGIIALCMFLGSGIGRIVAQMVGVNGDVGGVGFAMLLLILLCNYMERKNKKFSEATERGIHFLSAIYIPVVVAMSANQNVAAAFDGGVIAFVAGIAATVGGLLLVPLISSLGRKK